MSSVYDMGTSNKGSESVGGECCNDFSVEFSCGFEYDLLGFDFLEAFVKIELFSLRPLRLSLFFYRKRRKEVCIFRDSQRKKQSLTLYSTTKSGMEGLSRKIC